MDKTRNVTELFPSNEAEMFRNFFHQIGGTAKVTVKCSVKSATTPLFEGHHHDLDHMPFWSHWQTRHPWLNLVLWDAGASSGSIVCKSLNRREIFFDETSAQVLCGLCTNADILNPLLLPPNRYARGQRMFSKINRAGLNESARAADMPPNRAACSRRFEAAAAAR
jgi:hypothetical protein